MDARSELARGWANRRSRICVLVREGGNVIRRMIYVLAALAFFAIELFMFLRFDIVASH